MDKTININIAGILFQIEEDAYGILRDYLQAVNNRFKNVPGGVETVADIESRIAEIFESQKGTAGTISVTNVEAMISIIGKPEDFDNNDAEPEPETYTYTSQKKRMYRNPDDTVISGVCGGIGAYLNSDPVLFRILFVIFTLSFGVGIFLYLALWIALPSANTDLRRREMYGKTYQSAMSQRLNADGTYSPGSPTYNKGYYNTSRIGNALNEIFRAIGRVFYIAVRVLLIIFGVAFVLIGSLLILSLVLLLVFKYPASISSSSFDMNLIYLSDFLKYVVNPALVPWIIALSLIIFIIPMIALIYWGVKMIFWFRAKDGIFSLVAFVLWIMLIAILAVILFNEGISFAETARTSTQKIFSTAPDTLYIKAGNRSSDLIFEKELNFREDGYNIMISNEKKELYIRPYLKIYNSEKENARVELRKRSSGKNEIEAMKKTEDLIYNYAINRDTIILDEYFTIPAGRKWSADNIGINLYLPEGTILKLDKPSLRLLHSYISNEYYAFDDEEGIENCSNIWIVTSDGIEPASSSKIKAK
ncbi:MAG: PspC domain-containing protein [Bacteroidales bacterium]|nr:PspC domain-containing protein [Bacteroidales bacterium]